MTGSAAPTVRLIVVRRQEILAGRGEQGHALGLRQGEGLVVGRHDVDAMLEGPRGQVSPRPRRPSRSTSTAIRQLGKFLQERAGVLGGLAAVASAFYRHWRDDGLEASGREALGGLEERASPRADAHEAHLHVVLGGRAPGSGGRSARAGCRRPRPCRATAR